MREIRIDCFKDNQNCQIISERQNFQVSEAQDQEYLLVIQNFSDKDCQLRVSATSQDQSDLNLLIQKDQEIIFHDQLTNFFNQEINLGKISRQSTQNYTFYFDVSKLAFSKQKLSLNFDLNLNFSCQNPELISISEEQMPIQTNSAVLGAKISKQAEHKNLFFILLFCLFVFLFFVIMKIINGKKKKK